MGYSHILLLPNSGKPRLSLAFVGGIYHSCRLKRSAAAAYAHITHGELKHDQSSKTDKSSDLHGGRLDSDAEEITDSRGENGYNQVGYDKN